MGVDYSIPPYVIKDEDRGVEVDLLVESFKSVGITVELQYLPLLREFKALAEGSIDGMINVRENLVEDIYLSDVVITFNNVLVSLKESNYPETFPISFIKDKYIIAFQRAPEIIGEGLEIVTKNSSKYSETANQINQIYRLYTNRGADLIIIDENIFKYFKIIAEGRLGSLKDKEVVIHRIFKPTVYRFGFRTKKIRDDFNTGLSNIKKSGLYLEIFRRYGIEPIK